MTLTRLVAALVLLSVGACKKDAPAEEAPAETAKPEGQAGHEEVIELTAKAQQAAAIKLEKSTRKPLSVGVTAAARVGFTQHGVAKVAARVPGRISEVKVQLGQRVKKGDVLGYLESPELGRARADYLSASTRARVAGGNYQREKELQQKGITSERDLRLAEAEAAAAQSDMSAAEGQLHAFGLSDAEIQALKANEHYSSKFPARAPLDGVVVELNAIVGQTVEGATSLFTVADLAEVWVVIDVYEAQLSKVRVDQRVFVTVQAAPNKRFEGKVAYVGDIVEEKSRSVPVRVSVPNPEGLLKPGMFAQAEIESTEGAGGEDAGEGGRLARVIVARQAVQQIGDVSYVFVPAGERKYKAVRVRTGDSSAAEMEILSGLEENQEVVTAGAFILKSELSKDSLGEDE